MNSLVDARFEALVYTQDRTVEVECARVFAPFPLDWGMVRDSSVAAEYLKQQECDFLILDLDTPGADALLNRVFASADMRRVVLAITSAPADPSILLKCYAAQVYYPVRPIDLEGALYRAITFGTGSTLPGQCEQSVQFAREREQGQAAVDMWCAESEGTQTPGFVRGLRSFAASVFRMQHSLSVRAQERIASGISAIGTIWYVNEITTGFHGIDCIPLPSDGPKYLIAVSLLLWLCAKHRRCADGVPAAHVSC